MAQVELVQFESAWKHKYPHVVQQWHENLERLQGLWRFSHRVRKLIYTTNAIENVHNQQRKVLKTKRSFPNRESALRLMSLLARKITDKNFKKKYGKPDWRLIVAELHLHFGHRMPSQWGTLHS